MSFLLLLFSSKCIIILEADYRSVELFFSILQHLLPSVHAKCLIEKWKLVGNCSHYFRKNFNEVIVIFFDIIMVSLSVTSNLNPYYASY